MFITLKSSGRGDGEADMVQVATKSAGTGRRQVNRKSACHSCQMSNLRCSGRLRDLAGRLRDCDRCRSRSISCASSIIRDKPCSASRGNDSTLVHNQMDWDGLGHDGSHGSEPENCPSASAIDQSPRMDCPSDNLQGVFEQSSSQAMVTLPSSTSGTPAALLLDNLLAESEPLPSTSVQDDPDNDGWNGPVPCSCTNDLLGVVQRFDDDDFGLTSLSLDEVIKLLKWILFQCCKAIECPGCRALPAIHTILLAICTRITEMFECIHKRIRRVKQADGSRAGDQNPFADSAEPLSKEDNQPAGDLFCGASGRAAGQADCNPDLFPPAFRSSYSDEEQVHMIRVLLQIQMRNFRGLLERVDLTSQTMGSEARSSKVKSLRTRLLKAEADIEKSLTETLERLLA